MHKEENGPIERALGDMERLFLRQSIQGAGNTSGVLSLIGAWPVENLEAALHSLLRVYPRLGLTIDAEAEWFRLPSPSLKIPFVVLSREDDNHWRRVAEVELKRVYTHALVYVTVISGKLKSEIILSVHHSLADGGSLQAILRVLLKILAGENPSTLPFGAAIETRLPRSYQSWRGVWRTLGTLRRLLRKAPRNLFRPGHGPSVLTARTETASCTLDAEKSARWVKALKASGSNLFAGIAAMIMLTLRDRAGIKDACQMGINAPVSLRHKLQPEARIDELGLFISSVLTYYTILPTSDIFSLALKVHEKIHGAIAHGEDLSVVKLMRGPKKAKPYRENSPAARLQPSFSLSNLGVVPDFPPNFPAEVAVFRALGDLWPHDVLLITFSSYRGQIVIDVHASVEKLGVGSASSLASAFEKFLLKGPPS